MMYFSYHIPIAKRHMTICAYIFCVGGGLFVFLHDPFSVMVWSATDFSLSLWFSLLHCPSTQQISLERRFDDHVEYNLSILINMDIKNSGFPLCLPIRAYAQIQHILLGKKMARSCSLFSL